METGLLGTPINKENQLKAKADFKKMRDYQFKFKPGDKVKTSKGDEIILESYIQDGQPRCTTYPAGKKQSYGYHTWSHESNLQPLRRPK